MKWTKWYVLQLQKWISEPPWTREDFKRWRGVGFNQACTQLQIQFQLDFKIQLNFTKIIFTIYNWCWFINWIYLQIWMLLLITSLIFPFQWLMMLNWVLVLRVWWVQWKITVLSVKTRHKKSNAKNPKIHASLQM